MPLKLWLVSEETVGMYAETQHSNQPGKVLEQIGKPVVLVYRQLVPSNWTVVSTLLKHLCSNRPINSYCMRHVSMQLWLQFPSDIIIKHISGSCRKGWITVCHTVK